MLNDLIRLVKGVKRATPVVPIGVAMTPEFKRLLDLKCTKIGYKLGSAVIFTGLRVYVWDGLPIPCKLYYDQDIIDFEYQIYCKNSYDNN
jgi:hypothetical protein